MSYYHMTMVFPYCVIADSDAITAAAMIVLMRRDLGNGSSFAVTTDAANGQRKLWLSQASYEYLDAETDLFKGPGITPDTFRVDR